MVIIIVVVLVIALVSFILKNKIIFRFDTLFRKGFKKNTDKYGIYAFCGKQGER